ncbi:conserved hypothetical protein [Verticillium alfalfae VaMs.102]|uniref:Uncharacterized protein n=1 Tax=Verticillium alfalfae (strain VaMs.102 / ATCC MYA-4576 / FGSC 10136) TaxID=526221 RepID=C9SL45_VERA1|nr:conserved hypothetical protein [Verticillium alfalfae VaMs.102]EEY19413.1 conserved hypothetical protein [Verticillium alfalfae VaMs.102]
MLATKGFAIRSAGDASISNRKPALYRGDLPENTFMSLNTVCGNYGRSSTSLRARQQHMNALGHRFPSTNATHVTVISTARRMRPSTWTHRATGGTSAFAPRKCPVNSVSTSSAILNNTRWTTTATVAHVTDRAYNNLINAWETDLCHQVFNLRSSLNQHLNSPAPQQALYHCPKHEMPQEVCNAGALFNRLESETCGAMRFDDVERHAQAMLNPDRLLNYSQRRKVPRKI